MIILCFAYALELDEKASAVEEPHSVGAYNEILVNYGLGFGLLPVKDQLTDFIKAGQGTVAVVIVGTAAPEGLLVELDLLLLDTAIDHGSHVGVTKGQRFQPNRGRSVIPHDFVWTCFTLLVAGKGENTQYCAGKKGSYSLHNYVKIYIDSQADLFY